ncbi:RNA polymerase sigma factor [Pedobacter nyackensis]|uniref:RNA polymerase sigma-70 factor, ECF subfamily n=1 Tax=Pedobacter nyackensis TaxID=475255 RepID=A0A1W2ECH9_9SPHI|nr:RNA polymerase sigma-70 factor [Pedobacter nyackensis]SMD07450.1 RNA polymerase sigma-70 factor, ECF subfamily [Pedobacter nyackensis]
MNVKTHDESQLIADLLKSDESAFARVFDIYKAKLYSFAWRFLKNRELSEEVVQETLILLWTNRLTLDIRYPLGPYLYTIARRLTLNVLRNAATAGAAREKLWIDLNQAHNDTEEAILLADLEAFTEQSVSKLPARQQLIFKLSRYEGLTHEQIAETLNISKSTVNNHLVEALKTLHKQFKDSGISYSILIAWLFLK